MRIAHKALAGALLALVCGGAAAQAQDFADVTITATHVAGTVYMLEGAGGNIGVSLGEDGILLIDDQFAPLADKIRATLDSLGGGDLRFIINTHWHGDHVGGNEIFGSEATIIAHHTVRERLSTDQVSLGSPVPARPEVAWPVITLGASLSVHFNGEEIKAWHMPDGHTDGDLVIHFTGSNVVHLSDHLFTNMFPYIDLDHGGTVLGYLRNLDQLIEMIPADAPIIAGHGKLATVEDVRAMRAMIAETSELVRAQIKNGKSLDEVKAAGLPEKWASWSWSFVPTDRWLETLYKGLQ